MVHPAHPSPNSIGICREFNEQPPVSKYRCRLPNRLCDDTDCVEFSERFEKKTKCMADPENLFCWQDVKEILMDECGVNTAIDNIIEEDNREREKHGKRGE